ncbi:MAG: polymer-forming cytoskeletal protein [Acidobacteriota bacterium]|nr:polymer-forming cytoskeletal protein [Acidobacteriota bacterium]
MNSERRPATTHIAAGSKVFGEITGTTDLVIEGEIEGKLHLKNGVVVASSGVVRGEIKASSVRVAGKVQGNVEGHEMIEILPKGTLEGDATSPRVVISDGAFFKGNIDMDGG